MTHGSIRNVFLCKNKVDENVTPSRVNLKVRNHCQKSREQSHLEDTCQHQDRYEDRHAEINCIDDLDDVLIHVDQYRFPFDVQSEDQNQGDNREDLNRD